MEDSSRQRDSRWEDALRAAQEELDTLRDKHARERQRLEQHFHSTIAPDGTVEPQQTAARAGDELLQANVGEAELQEEEGAGFSDLKLPEGDSATDVLRLHEQLLRANEKVSRQNEQVSRAQQHRPAHNRNTILEPSQVCIEHSFPVLFSPTPSVCVQLASLRAAHSRLLVSEGKYREKSATLAAHYQQAIDEIRHLHSSSQHSQHSQHRIRAEIASLAVEFKAMEVALLDKTQQLIDSRAEMARRDDEGRREREEKEERWRRKKAEWKSRETELIRQQAERERGLKELMVRQAEEREEEVRRAEQRVSEMEAEMNEVSAKHRDECRHKEEQLYEAREQIQSAAAAAPLTRVGMPHAPATHPIGFS